jgi:hypothetical protein
MSMHNLGLLDIPGLVSPTAQNIERHGVGVVDILMPEI